MCGKMDAVNQISMVENIRKRVGMYWQTHDGIPDASVWIFFLDQLANEMGATFMRGEASYVDIRYDNESKTVSIECDGSAVTDDLRGVCDGIGSDKQFDKHIYPSTSSGEDDTIVVTDQWGEVGFDKDYAPLITKELADKIRERIVAVAQQIERTRGTIPEHLANIVRAALLPQIRWQEVLAQFVTSCYGGSRRWLPPNRRHISQGLYLQSSRKERLQAAVAIDTSGSTTADLPQFFSELTSLLNTFGDYELTVMQCDCEIQNVEKFDAYNPFHSIDWKAYGHGGTDFRPPFVYVAEHSEIEPSCLIYITDGCGPAPDNPPPYPVLWILTGNGEKPAPWGWDLRLRQS